MTDPHFEAAKGMKNFSQWVREHLEEYIQEQTKELPQTNYICQNVECEGSVGFRRPMINCRVRGVHYPTQRTCPACEKSASRWDLV